MLVARSKGYTTLFSMVSEILNLGVLTCPRVKKTVSAVTQHAFSLAQSPTHCKTVLYKLDFPVT